MMMLKIFLAKCWRLAVGGWLVAFGGFCFFLFTGSLVYKFIGSLLHRIHKTLLHFIEGYGAENEDEDDENTTPQNTHEIKTAGT